MFSRTGLSNLLSLPLKLRCFLLDFRDVHQFWLSITRGWVGGKQKGAGGVGGGEGGGKKPQVKTRATGRPQMVLTIQLGRRDIIPVEGRIPGWLHPIGALHRCQCVSHGFTRL